MFACTIFKVLDILADSTELRDKLEKNTLYFRSPARTSFVTIQKGYVIARSVFLLVIMALVQFVSAEVIFQNGRFYDTVKTKYVACRGVEYIQPEAMHWRFWTDLDIERMKADFELIKERGFDTIMISPDWRSLIPEVWYFDADFENMFTNGLFYMDETTPLSFPGWGETAAVDASAKHCSYFMLVSAPGWGTPSNRRSLSKVRT